MFGLQIRVGNTKMDISIDRLYKRHKQCVTTAYCLFAYPVYNNPPSDREKMCFLAGASILSIIYSHPIEKDIEFDLDLISASACNGIGTFLDRQYTSISYWHNCDEYINKDPEWMDKHITQVEDYLHEGKTKDALKPIPGVDNDLYYEGILSVAHYSKELKWLENDILDMDQINEHKAKVCQYTYEAYYGNGSWENRTPEKLARHRKFYPHLF